MPAVRIAFSALLAIAGIIAALYSLGEAYRAAQILYSYQEVEGVVVAVRDGHAWVNYTRPDGANESMRVSGGGKSRHRYVGKKLTILLPPAGRHDDASPVLEEDFGSLYTLLIVTMCFFLGAASAWPVEAQELRKTSSRNSFVRYTHGPDETNEWEKERQQRLRASIDLEIAERIAQKRASSRNSKTNDPK